MNIGTYTFEEFKEIARSFHGYPAPGLLIGGFMVEAVKRKMPEGTLFEAIVETKKCLPDAVQLLTLCSTGNGWMRVMNLGKYAVSLYDKHTGEGWRASIAVEKLKKFPEIEAWFLKLKAKQEQDTEKLFDEIKQAGDGILMLAPIVLKEQVVRKKHMTGIKVCPLCQEAYPSLDGAICRSCQGENPYLAEAGLCNAEFPGELKAVPVEQSVGRRALHDMTRIVKGESKGPAVHFGQVINAGDVCRLQQMGRSSIYIEGSGVNTEKWMHENDAALAFAEKMAGAGVYYKTPPQEGKIDFYAKEDGLLQIDGEMLHDFNLVPNVMCATRQNNILVEKDKAFAACRAIPLYLAREHFELAIACLNQGALLQVLPLKPARVGILVTGTEVYLGLIEDKFQPIIKSKVEKLNCEVVCSKIVNDDADAISKAVKQMTREGADLIITTAGLSVDPDDQTRNGLNRAGLVDALYGAPILPGAMMLLGRIQNAKVIGVPACALFFKVTSLDLLLPRVLAGQEITRQDLAAMAEGGFCLNCNACTFPKCPFGK